MDECRAELRRLADTLPGPEVERVLRYARGLADTDDGSPLPADEIAEAVSRGDLAEASRLAIVHWDGREMVGIDRLAGVLESLPLRQLRRFPVLAMVLALHYRSRPGRSLRSGELFALAVASARLSTKQPADTRALIGVIETGALRSLGLQDAALAAARRAERLLERADAVPMEAPQLPKVAALADPHLAITYFNCGRWPQGRDAAERGYQRPGTAGEINAFHSLALMAGMYALGGEMTLAAALATDARARRAAYPDFDGYHGAYLRIAESLLALDGDDVAAAREALAGLGPHLTTIEHWPVIAMIEGRIGAAEQDPVRAEAQMAALLTRGARPPATPYLRALFDSVRALLLTASGRPNLALDLMRRHPASVPEVVSEIARAQLHMGRSDQAERALAALRSSNTPVVVRTRVEQLILSAQAAEHLGDRSRAGRIRDQAAGLASAHGMALRTRHLPDPADAAPTTELTRAERAVLNLLAAGATRPEIAAQLFVSQETIKSHLRSIYRKLGVGSRTDAVRVAHERWLLDQ